MRGDALLRLAKGLVACPTAVEAIQKTVKTHCLLLFSLIGKTNKRFLFYRKLYFNNFKPFLINNWNNSSTVSPNTHRQLWKCSAVWVSRTHSKSHKIKHSSIFASPNLFVMLEVLSLKTRHGLSQGLFMAKCSYPSREGRQLVITKYYF